MTPASPNTGPATVRALYAALQAAACNIWLADMARSSSPDYQVLWWKSHQYLQEDDLKAATGRMVNQQHGQWLARHWGGGGLSSSDGQQFPVSGAVRNAKALPHYFGYGQGVTFHTHTADHYAQYDSKVIPVTKRDATYVLDEILGNETELVIVEHATAPAARRHGFGIWPVRFTGLAVLAPPARHRRPKALPHPGPGAGLSGHALYRPHPAQLH